MAKPRRTHRPGNKGVLARVAERREKVWQLLISGRHTYRDIARQCDVNVSTAHDDVQAVIKEHNDRLMETAHGFIAEASARLLKGFEAIMGDVETGAVSRFDAIDRLVKLNREWARLHGLDKPIKVAQTDPSGEYSTALDLSKLSPETLAKLMQELEAK